MKNIVYVVSHGEQYEGGRVISVHKSVGKAVQAALAVKCHFPGDWVFEDNGIWTNGCDFVCVKSYEVKP